MKGEDWLILSLVLAMVCLVLFSFFVFGQRDTIDNYCVYNGYEKMQLIDGDYYCQTGNEFAPVEWME